MKWKNWSLKPYIIFLLSTLHCDGIDPYSVDNMNGCSEKDKTLITKNLEPQNTGLLNEKAQSDSIISPNAIKKETTDKDPDLVEYEALQDVNNASHYYDYYDYDYGHDHSVKPTNKDADEILEDNHRIDNPLRDIYELIDIVEQKFPIIEDMRIASKLSAIDENQSWVNMSAGYAVGTDKPLKHTPYYNLDVDVLAAIDFGARFYGYKTRLTPHYFNLDHIELESKKIKSSNITHTALLIYEICTLDEILKLEQEAYSYINECIKKFDGESKAHGDPRQINLLEYKMKLAYSRKRINGYEALINNNLEELKRLEPDMSKDLILSLFNPIYLKITKNIVSYDELRYINPLNIVKFINYQQAKLKEEKYNSLLPISVKLASSQKDEYGPFTLSASTDLRSIQQIWHNMRYDCANNLMLDSQYKCAKELRDSIKKITDSLNELQKLEEEILVRKKYAIDKERTYNGAFDENNVSFEVVANAKLEYIQSKIKFISQKGELCSAIFDLLSKMNIEEATIDILDLNN